MRAPNCGSYAAARLQVFDLRGYLSHQLNRRLPQRENPFPRREYEFTGLFHVRENLCHDGIALKVPFGESVDIHVGCLGGILIANGGYPLVNERSSRRLQQVIMRQGAAVFHAGQELQQIPGRIRKLGAGVDGIAVGGCQGDFA